MLTILTTTRNAVSTLPETLASVRELAELVPVEHLLLDAGSTDGTWEVIERHAADADWARATRRPDLPLVDSLNHLVAQAGGDRILVLHGDDRLEPDAVAEVLARPVDGILCGDVRMRSRTGKALGLRRSDPGALGSYMAINHPAMLVPTQTYRRIGTFDPRFPVSFDYEWTWRAWRRGVPFVRHPVVLAEVRLGGLSTVAERRAAGEIFRFKLRDGAVGLALAGYGVYAARRAAELLLPPRAAQRLRRWKRSRFGSVDEYTPPSRR